MTFPAYDRNSQKRDRTRRRKCRRPFPSNNQLRFDTVEICFTPGSNPSAGLAMASERRFSAWLARKPTPHALTWQPAVFVAKQPPAARLLQPVDQDLPRQVSRRPRAPIVLPSNAAISQPALLSIAPADRLACLTTSSIPHLGSVGKAVLDCSVAGIALLLLTPLLLLIALAIRLDSTGPVIFTHQLRDRIAYDFQYIATWSLLLDLRILLITPIRLATHAENAF